MYYVLMCLVLALSPAAAFTTQDTPAPPIPSVMSQDLPESANIPGVEGVTPFEMENSNPPLVQNPFPQSPSQDKQVAQRQPLRKLVKVVGRTGKVVTVRTYLFSRNTLRMTGNVAGKTLNRGQRFTERSLKGMGNFFYRSGDKFGKIGRR